MRTLLVHPSGLMCSEIVQRLDPLGAERAAAARAGNVYVRTRPRHPASTASRDGCSAARLPIWAIPN